jgi:hypothetical protein
MEAVLSSRENKKTLIELASRSVPRPEKGTPLGRALGSYINEQGQHFDSEFLAKLRELAPHWFRR